MSFMAGRQEGREEEEGFGDVGVIYTKKVLIITRWIKVFAVTSHRQSERYHLLSSTSESSWLVADTSLHLLAKTIFSQNTSSAELPCISPSSQRLPPNKLPTLVLAAFSLQ